MKILGVDPHGSKPYGFAILERREGSGVEVLTSGTCDLAGLSAMIREDRPDAVAVEDQYMNKNYKVAKALSWSAGKVMGVAEMAGTPWVVVNVATWKAKMGAQKGQHIKRVLELFSLKCGDDEASAVLIAAYAIGVRGT